MSRQSWLLLVALIPGAFAAGWLLRPQLPAPHAPPPASAGSATATANTAQESARLEDTLFWLQDRLAQTEQERDWLAERLAAMEAGLEAPVIQRAAEAPAGKADAETAPVNRTYQTGVETLIAAGFTEPQAADIQARLDAIDLKNLYLEDRARREGWLGTARYQEETRELREQAFRELRPQIGDESYDRLLYALKRPNRVMVREVIQLSPAAQADLQPGDRIIEYDGQRIFTIPELQTLTGKGTAGAPVLVRLKRTGGESLNVYLPRGPLGIRPIRVREAPD
jgi:membrane-associated protease RseP (regulator of RpoE activity)